MAPFPSPTIKTADLDPSEDDESFEDVVELSPDTVVANLVVASPVVANPSVVLLAPHGGDIETRTGEQLKRVTADLRAFAIEPAVWVGRGVQGEAFQYALALHGFSWGPQLGGSVHRRGIILGGGATNSEKLAFKSAIEAAIEIQTGTACPIAFYIADDIAGDQSFPAADGDLATLGKTQQLRGTDPDNLVNRLCPLGGIQLVQSRGVNEDAALAAAVAMGCAWALAEAAELPVPAATAST